MGTISNASSATLILASSSRYDDALTWTREKTSASWSHIALASDVFDFGETDYYEASMGTGLKKVFLAFERLIDPAELPELKIQTNLWEEEYASATEHDVASWCWRRRRTTRTVSTCERGSMPR